MRLAQVGWKSSVFVRGRLCEGPAIAIVGARAATKVAMLSRLTSLRTARLVDRVSLAWSGIIALLAAETPHSRASAYEAFRALSPEEQNDMLDYLEVTEIEEAHPRIG